MDLRKRRIGKTGGAVACAVGLAIGCAVLLHVSRPRALAAASGRSRCRPAIGYYIVIGARFEAPNLIRVTGATNLPAGSGLAIWVYDAALRVVGGGDNAVAVGADGLFAYRARPKPGVTFDPEVGYICSVVFEADPRVDPPAVMRAVGPRGERLGLTTVNPEVGLNSGGWYLSEEALVH
jgi:hypothetical protein